MSNQLEIDEIPWPAPRYRLIVAGSRSWTDYELMRAKLRAYWKEVIPKDAQGIEIVSGTARGADELGEKIAHACQVPCKQFPADWDTFGKAAGYRRNEQMANYADGAIIFWDGKSRGSFHMGQLAIKHGLDLWIVSPDGSHTSTRGEHNE